MSEKLVIVVVYFVEERSRRWGLRDYGMVIRFRRIRNLAVAWSGRGRSFLS